MDIKKLSAIADSAPKKPLKGKSLIQRRRVSDSFRTLKRKIKDSLDETETTEDAIIAVEQFLDTEEPQEVIQATVEVLADIIDKLEEVGNGSSAEGEDEIV